MGSSSIVIESDYSGIFHCDEGGNVEQVARTSITILCLWDCLHLISLTLTPLYYRTNILSFLFFSRVYLFEHPIHQESNYEPQLLFKRNHNEKLGALHGVYGFIS